MKRLFLTDDPLPLRKYILTMACLSVMGSILIAVILNASGFFDQVGPDVKEWQEMGTTLVVFVFLVVSPILETLTMVFFIFLISLVTKSPVRIAVASSILWGILHSLAAPTWGLIICWPFFVFSCAYLTWRRRSWWKGFYAAAAIHFLQNLLPAIAFFAISA